MNAAARTLPVAPVDRLVNAVRERIEEWLPWFDRSAANRTHKVSRILISRAEEVIGSYRKADQAYRR